MFINYLLGPHFLADWLEFAASCLIQLSLTFLPLPIANHQALKFDRSTLSVILIYSLVFACMEKIRKEQYVIGYTNAKTKKIFVGLLN